MDGLNKSVRAFETAAKQQVSLLFEPNLRDTNSDICSGFYV
jgi:hypothetical protein